MKKILMFFSLLLLVASCSKDESGSSSNDETSTSGAVEFSAAIIDLVESRAVSMADYWSGDEQIIIFAEDGESGYTYDVAEDGSLSAVGSEIESDGTTTVTYYAFYPVDASCTSLDDYLALEPSASDVALAATAQGVKSIELNFSFNLAAIYLFIESEDSITSAEVTVGDSTYPLELSTSSTGIISASLFVLPEEDLSQAELSYETSAGADSYVLDTFSTWEAGRFYVYNIALGDQIEGDGSQSNPYRIYTKEDLAAMCNGGEYYRLMNDIDLSCDAANPWTPIYYFDGVFDGNGYTISGIYIDSEDDYQGLFGYVYNSAVIANLTVEGQVTSTGKCTGGIAGNSNQSHFINCHNRVNVTGTSRVGGVTGGGGYCAILNCSNVGTIIGDDYDDSYYSDSKQQRVGGIAGTSGSSYIINCYNAGSVTNNSGDAYAVVSPGGDDDYLELVFECYYSNDCGGVDPKATSQGVDDSYIKSAAFVSELNYGAALINGIYSSEYGVCVHKWSLDSDGYPVPNRVDATAIEFEVELQGSGTESDPYLISSASDLYYMAELNNMGVFDMLNPDTSSGDIVYSPSASSLTRAVVSMSTYTYFELTCNIDLEGSESNPWTPIGTSYSRIFDNVFNGAGHTVSGLYINGSARYSSLFGYTINAIICNLTVEGEVTSTGQNSGGVVGMLVNSTILNCHNSVNVTGTSRVGGIAGGAGNSCIYNCSNSGAIIGNDYDYSNNSDSKQQRVGGIAGTSGNTWIMNCYNVGTVQNLASGSIAYAVAAPGGNDSYEQTVDYCYYSEECGGQDPAETSTSMSLSAMKDEAFVTTLNNNASELEDDLWWITFSLTTWELGESGFPVTTY